MSLPLFVYGSLRDAAVRARVLGGRRGAPPIATEPAMLRGYVWQMAPGFGYPFVTPGAADDAVDGEILHGLAADDYARLDRYEDTDSGLYVRVRVSVETAHGPAEAWTYCKGPNAPA